MKTNYCWHYTTAEKFNRINETGAILTEDQTTGIIEGLRGAVWFTTRQTFEPTARKGIIENGKRRTATLEEMRKYCGGLVRIGVKADSAFLFTWETWKEFCTIGRDTIRGLAQSARRQGSDVATFRASLDPVMKRNWDAVEFEQNGEWVRVLTKGE